MKTLTIRELAPYLPYGLKVMTYHNVVANTGNYFTLEKHLNGQIMLGGYSLQNIKPLLRPLSDLTREIEHNGDRFVPIIRLNQMRGVAVAQENYDEIFIDGDCHGCKWAGVYSFYFEEQTMSFYCNSKDGISPQLEMFNALHEWHFDLYNLIPSGLALPITK